MLNQIQNDAGRYAGPELQYPKYINGQAHGQQSKELYFALSSGPPTEQVRDSARTYLEQQLEATHAFDSDLPGSLDALGDWTRANAHKIGLQYSGYLEQRRAGAPRRYFSTKAHALNFLQGVAPTKLVDGSWLYGLVRYWNDDRFHSLIRIYLEELGEGLPEKNHVVLYKKLLASHGCEQWRSLSDAHFVQGAIQLALAQHADRFLPEVIGFNLGYEQLPLHLLITAYELNELDIDPYYFTLHITVDNASTGHAQKAIDGLKALFPHLADGPEFYRRVINGYKLNLLGASTTSVIAAFDIEHEMVKVLRDKSAVGMRMHSDFCRIAGRTVNDWLADPERIPDFLHSLEQQGWIKRHQPPYESRFWRLLEGDRAEMFGVFNPYEKQVIHDWILGDSESKKRSDGNVVIDKPMARQMTFRARQRLMRTLQPEMEAQPSATSFYDNDEHDADIQALQARLAMPKDRQETMNLLVELMAPTRHHTPTGLMATRIFNWMIDKQVCLI
jgi:hypothetical protein